jgi:hypothetical protein
MLRKSSDVLELPVAVAMIRALLCVAVGLQAEPKRSSADRTREHQPSR